jgi:hypothetical protein
MQSLVVRCLVVLLALALANGNAHANLHFASSPRCVPLKTGGLGAGGRPGPAHRPGTNSKHPCGGDALDKAAAADCRMRGGGTVAITVHRAPPAGASDWI